jgi:hypothetical protein
VSDIGIADRGARSVFGPATVALMIVVGAIGFVGLMVIGAYAPELGQGSRAGAHALSNAATGYSGLVRLAAAGGLEPRILRDEREWDNYGLVVVTPEAAAIPIGGVLEARSQDLPTLFILPKWQTVPDPDNTGWVRVNGLLPASEPEGVFAPGNRFQVTRHETKVAALVLADPDLPPSLGFVPPDKLQVISGQSPGIRLVPDSAGTPGSGDPPVAVYIDPNEDEAYPAEDGYEADEGGEDEAEEPYQELEPVITDGAGGIVLGRIGELYILSDPDLLDNAAMKDPQNAAAAIRLLDWLNYESEDPIGFDVVLNGLGGNRSLLRLAFDPPFLAMTLALAAMIVLLGLRALGRFGPPRLRERALAFGKAALVDNGAMLVRKAGKTHRLGGRFAAVIRDQAMRAFGVSPRLKPAEIDAYLDRLGGEQRFTELAARAEDTDDDSRMLAACRALHAWKQEKLSDH